jgi:peptide/nickel transport system permease protein
LTETSLKKVLPAISGVEAPTSLLIESILNEAWRFARDYKLAAAGAGITLLFVLTAIFAPQLAPMDPDQVNARDALASSSPLHLLGTDNQGRDLLSRMIWGARMSLYISLAAILSSTVIGAFLGMLAADYARLDMWIMRVMDILLAFPAIIVALTIIAILGNGVNNVVIAIAVYHIPQYARLAQGLTLSVKQSTFVEAAVATGNTDAAIMARYILPNIMAPLIVQTTLLIPAAIMTAASLSFLGLGVPPPTAEWGSMLQNSLQWASMAPHVMIVPGLSLMLVVFGFNVMGDGLRDAMDPRLNTGRRGIRANGLNKAARYEASGATPSVTARAAR